jgi:hypothetical protein
MIFLNLLFVLGAALAETPPEYENSINEKIPATEKVGKEEQSTFFKTINAKSQEVMKFIRVSKDQLSKKHTALKKDFEDSVKKEMSELKKQDPKAKLDELRKSTNEKRKELFIRLNDEKKSTETQLNTYKKQFDEFVKNRKLDFQQLMKTASAKINAAKLAKPEDTELEREFREIPPGKGTVLAPGN